MLISGLNYRSFAEQIGVTFDLRASLNNSSGSGEFGFSGENNKINFKFNSGRIYDFEDRYIFSYLKDVSFQISGDIDTGNYSYYINNYPTCFNGIKNNFKLENFYVKTDENSILDIDLKIYGDTPNYNIFINDKYFIDSFLTGVISNNNLLNFKIFSGEIAEPTQNFSIVTLPQVVSGISESNIIFQPNTGENVYSITLNLYTNFGLVTRNFVTTGRLSSLADMIFLLGPEDFYLSGQLGFPYLQYNPISIEQDYSFAHRGVNSVGEDYYGFTDNILFEFHSGYLGSVKGNILGSNEFSTGINTGVFYGTGTINIELTGYNMLTGLNLSGFKETGYNLLSTGIQTFPISGSGETSIVFKVTGLGFINYSGVRPLFGDYSSDFDITATGVVSGYIFDVVSPYLATGICKTLYDKSRATTFGGGSVIAGSGVYLFDNSGLSGRFTGIASAPDFNPPNPLPGNPPPANQLSIQKHFLRDVSGFFFKTEFITGLRDVRVTGNATGISTGYATTFFTNSGYPIYSGRIINTGYLNEINSGFFIATGFYSGDASRLQRTGLATINSFTGFFFGRPEGIGLFRYISTSNHITATGLGFNTGYNIYSENISNYSGAFYDSSGGLGFGALGGTKKYNFLPTKTQRGNLVLLKDSNPISISGFNIRVQGTLVTAESATGSWINKIKRFGDLYFVLGDFTLAGGPNTLITRRGGALFSGENLTLLPWDPGYGVNFVLNETNPIAPYDCYIDETGGIYINAIKMNIYNTSPDNQYSTYNYTTDQAWNPLLGGVITPWYRSYDTSSYSNDPRQTDIPIWQILPDKFERDLYYIGPFSTSKNVSKNSAREVYFKNVDYNFLFNKIVKLDRTSAQPITEDDYYLDYIGQQEFKLFNTNDKAEISKTADENENVYCMIRTGNKLYLGGSFNMVGSASRGGFAVYNKSGVLQPSQINIITQSSPAGRDINHSINSVVDSGNYLFLAGSISSFGANKPLSKNYDRDPSRQCLIRLKNPINTDRTFLPVKVNIGTTTSPTAFIEDMNIFNNKIYAVGKFNRKLDLTGEAAVSPDFNKYITGICILDENGEKINSVEYSLSGASDARANTIFITGNTGFLGGFFGGINIDVYDDALLFETASNSLRDPTFRHHAFYWDDLLKGLLPEITPTWGFTRAFDIVGTKNYRPVFPYGRYKFGIQPNNGDFSSLGTGSGYYTLYNPMITATYLPKVGDGGSGFGPWEIESIAPNPNLNGIKSSGRAYLRRHYGYDDTEITGFTLDTPEPERRVAMRANLPFDNYLEINKSLKFYMNMGVKSPPSGFLNRTFRNDWCYKFLNDVNKLDSGALNFSGNHFGAPLTGRMRLLQGASLTPIPIMDNNTFESNLQTPGWKCKLQNFSLSGSTDPIYHRQSGLAALLSYSGLLGSGHGDSELTFEIFFDKTYFDNPVLNGWCPNPRSIVDYLHPANRSYSIIYGSNEYNELIYPSGLQLYRPFYFKQFLNSSFFSESDWPTYSLNEIFSTEIETSPDQINWTKSAGYKLTGLDNYNSGYVRLKIKFTGTAPQPTDIYNPFEQYTTPTQCWAFPILPLGIQGVSKIYPGKNNIILKSGGKNGVEILNFELNSGGAFVNNVPITIDYSNFMMPTGKNMYYYQKCANEVIVTPISPTLIKINVFPSFETTLSVPGLPNFLSVYTSGSSCAQNLRDSDFYFSSGSASEAAIKLKNNISFLFPGAPNVAQYNPQSLYKGKKTDLDGLIKYQYPIHRFHDWVDKDNYHYGENSGVISPLFLANHYAITEAGSIEATGLNLLDQDYFTYLYPPYNAFSYTPPANKIFVPALQTSNHPSKYIQVGAAFISNIKITDPAGFYDRKANRYNFAVLDLENNGVLPIVHDSLEGEIFSIKSFDQDWIESRNEFDPKSEIIDEKLNTIIVLGSFDKLYTGYLGNTTDNRTTDANGIFFLDATNPQIRYSGLRTGIRTIKYLSSGNIFTGNNFREFNHRDVISLKNYNLNNTFDFIYGTGIDYQYSSTVYNDYGEIRFKTLNDIATYINNPNSLTISSPPNWSNLYNNFTGETGTNSLKILYKTSGTISGDFPFISLEYIGKGLFEKTFSVSENNNITGEINPSTAITKRYIGDFCSTTRTGDILLVGNSNWRNQASPTSASGAAYIYKNNNNNFDLIKILSGSGHTNYRLHSHYGFNGDINYDGSIIAVGAKNFVLNSSRTTGIVEIYSGSNYDWNFDQRLSGIFSGISTGLTSHFFTTRDFGKSLSLDYLGNRIAISDVLKKQNSTGSNIHIFQHINNNWILENVIDLSPYDIYDVKLNDYGNILALGQSTGLGGSIKIITKTGVNWSTALTGEILSESPNNQIYLGASIDMNAVGNTIVAGAPNAINNNINCGAVFVYTGMNTNWSQAAKITGNNLIAGERFGHSVKINKDGTILSVFSKNSTTGKAYIFTGFQSNWKQYQEFLGFSGAQTGISGVSGNYINAESGINDVIDITDSGNLLFISDTISGIVRSFNLPYQSRPVINQFDGGYEQKYITFRYPESNITQNNFRGYEKLDDKNYYLYGDIVNFNNNGPYINNTSLSLSSYPNYTQSGAGIILISSSGWETGLFFPVFNSPTIYKAKIFKDKLYVGGSFSRVGKTSSQIRDIPNLVCLNPRNGNILNPFSGLFLNARVNDINIWNDSLLIVGNFEKSDTNKVYFDHFMNADENGNLYTSYNFGTLSSYGIRKIYIDNNNKIYLMGDQESIANSSDNSAKFAPSIFSKSSGTKQTNFYRYESILPIICLNKTPSGYEIPYNTFNKNLPKIADIGAGFDAASDLGRQVSFVSKIITGEEGFYIGGSFNNINGITRSNAALIGYDGSLKPWSPILNGPVYDMVKSGDRIFIGGDFNDVNNGWGVNNIVEVSATGAGGSIASINQNFDPILDSVNINSEIYGTKFVSKIFLESGYIYLGGTFYTANELGQPVVRMTGFAAFERDGRLAFERTENIKITTNRPDVHTPEIRCIEKIDDIFLLGGYFDYVNNQNIVDFVPIKLDGTIIPFPSGLISQKRNDYTPTQSITDIKVVGNHVYLVGPSLSWYPNKNPTNGGGGRLGGACRLIYTGNKFIIDKNWAPAFELVRDNSQNAAIYAPRKIFVDNQENSYIFGKFRRAGYFRPGICELENDKITNFNPMIDLLNKDNYVRVIDIYDNNNIIIGGDFQNFASTGNISGVEIRNNVAVININNSELNSWNGNFGSDGEIRTILVDQEKDQIHIGGKFNFAASRPFDNLITLGHASGSQVKMRPYIINNDKGTSNIFVNSIIKKDDHSLLIGGKIGDIASYVNVSGSGILSSGSGLYNDYIPTATGITFVSGLFANFLLHTGFNQKNITGRFLYSSDINYASGSIYTGISGLTPTPKDDAFIKAISILFTASGGDGVYTRPSGGYTAFNELFSLNSIRYSGDLNTWLLYTGTGYNSSEALYKSDNLLVWENYNKGWSGEVNVSYSEYYSSGFKPNDLFILSHRNSNSLWNFVFGTGEQFQYSQGSPVDQRGRIKFDGLSGLYRYINDGGSYTQYYPLISTYYTGTLINNSSGQTLIITAKSTGSNFPDTNLYYYGSGNPLIHQLEGENNNLYVETNLTLNSNPILKTTNIFVPFTGIQDFFIPILTGQTNLPINNVTGMWLSTGIIDQNQTFNISNSDSGHYKFTGNFTGLPLIARLISKNDIDLNPFSPFTGYRTDRQIVTGAQTAYIFSGEFYEYSTYASTFSGIYQTTGRISGTVTGTTPDGFIFHVPTGIPYIFDSGDPIGFSGAKLIPNYNIFSGIYENLITGLGQLSGNYFYTGVTGIYLSGTGIESITFTGRVTGILEEYKPIFNESFAQQIFSSGLYENKFTGDYSETISVSGLNGPFYGTGFYSEGLITGVELYIKTFTGSFEIQTGAFLNTNYQKLPLLDEVTYFDQINIANQSLSPLSISIKYKSYFDKYPLVGKLSLINPAQGKAIIRYITGEIT